MRLKSMQKYIDFQKHSSLVALIVNISNQNSAGVGHVENLGKIPTYIYDYIYIYIFP